MSRRPLLSVLAVAAIGLTACGTPEVAAPVAATEATELPTTPTPDPATEAAELATTPAPTPSAEDEGSGTESVPVRGEGGVAVSPVTLALDGREVPLATVCAGVDGSILATTEGEVTVTLVREEGTALRYQAEGSTAETDEVAVEGGTDTTTHRATLSSPEVAPVAVTMVVMDDAMAALAHC